MSHHIHIECVYDNPRDFDIALLIKLTYSISSKYLCILKFFKYLLFGLKTRHRFENNLSLS